MSIQGSSRFFKSVEILSKTSWPYNQWELSKVIRQLDKELIKIWSAFCEILKQAFHLKKERQDEIVLEQIKKDSDPSLVDYIRQSYFAELKSMHHKNLKECFLSSSLTLVHECIQRLIERNPNSMPSQKDYEKVIASMRHAWIEVPKLPKKQLKKAFSKQNFENLLQDLEYYMFNTVSDKGIVMICGQMKQICESMLTYCELIHFSAMAKPNEQLSASKYFEKNKPIIETAISKLLAYEACKVTANKINTGSY